MDLLTFLMRSPDGLPRPLAQQLSGAWSTSLARKGAQLVMQGDTVDQEFILLNGCAVSEISDAEGRSVCVGLFVGPCVVTPNVARSQNDTSLVTLTTQTDSLIAQMPTQTLTARMLASEPVREWANAILRDELGRKAAREWCLAALGGADRLAWFRQTYPGFEDVFPHTLIASFIGVTPVTFSRLRTGAKG